MGAQTYAQTLPSTGTLLETVRPVLLLPPRDGAALPEAPVRPALILDASVKIAVKSIRIGGGKTFGEAELQTLVAHAVGQELTLADLAAVAQRITRHYRDAGYLLARAYLPTQDIKDGVVEIAVLEGRLGKLRIENGSSLANATVVARLADIKENQALEGAALERELLLLNDLPGVEVRSTLKPGASVGTTDLDIQLTDRSPYSGSLELDNFGNRYTGDMRLGGSLAVGNLFGLADTLAMRALTAEGMDYSRIAWQAPVGHAGTQLGAAYSDMRYRLGRDFAGLKAHGTATIVSLYALHPFQRGRAANLNGQINHDSKRLNDAIDFTATITAKMLDVWTVGISGNRVDGLLGGGLSNLSVAYTAGHLKLDPASQVLDAAGHRTAGNYDKLILSLARLQALANGINLYASFQAQQAGKNLDTAEKMTLGGAQAVRAYPQGEAPADDAWLASLELRYAFRPNWQASLFHDVAEGRLNYRPIAADTNNHRRIGGYGLGLGYSQPGELSVQLGVSWRSNIQPTSDVDRSPRTWVQLVQRF